MMKINFLLLLISVVYLKQCISTISPNKVEMIVDILNSYEKPTAVMAKVCWKLSEKKQFAKKIYDLQKPSSINYFKNNEAVGYFDKNNHIIFIMDLNCNNPHIINMLNTQYLFSKSYRWLVLSSNTNITVPNEFKDLDISVDSEVIVAHELPNNEYRLQTIYRVKPHGAWNIEYYGTWSTHYGFNKSEGFIVSNAMRRRDFKGETIIVTTVITDNRTRTDLSGLADITVDTVTRYAYRIEGPLYDFLNATRKLIFTNTWGYYINGSWNGMLRDIKNKDADICGTVTFLQQKRLEVLEYLMQPSSFSIKFLFRQPPLSLENNLFLLPFTMGVWYCLSAFVVILTIVLFANTKWDVKKYEKYNKKSRDQTCLIPTWSETTMFMLTALLQQGSSNELKGTLGRLVMFLIFMSFLFLYTSYSANIVALLQSSSNQIKTLSDLLNSKLELATEDTPYNKYYFSADYARTADPIRRSIYENKMAYKGKAKVFEMHEGVKQVQTKPFAFHMNLGVGYRVVSKLFQEHEKCGLQEIQYLPDTKVWMTCSKTSPFKEVFKIGYMRIQEHGMTDRENRLIYASKPMCMFRGGSFSSVNMVDCYPVFLMLLYGMILAFSLLGIEILVHRKIQLQAGII